MNDYDCKRMLSKLGFKYGVSPRLIALKLLSDEDKDDMRNDRLPEDALDCAVRIWVEQGMFDYAKRKS